MKHTSLCLWAAVAGAPQAVGETIFTAQLTGDQVASTPSGSPGLAFGTFTLNDTMTMLSFDITFSGLTSSASAASR